MSNAALHLPSPADAQQAEDALRALSSIKQRGPRSIQVVKNRNENVAVTVPLLVYALGFALPMLLLGYGSQALRQRLRAVARHPVAVRWVSGTLLVGFGLLVLWKGMLFIGM